MLGGFHPHENFILGGSHCLRKVAFLLKNIVFFSPNYLGPMRFIQNCRYSFDPPKFFGSWVPSWTSNLLNNSLFNLFKISLKRWVSEFRFCSSSSSRSSSSCPSTSTLWSSGWPSSSPQPESQSISSESSGRTNQSGFSKSSVIIIFLLTFFYFK